MACAPASPRRVREFCEFRNLVPRGLKLTPEDVFDKVSFVLSIKMHEPQFAGQTKERLASRDAASIVESVVQDALSLWLNQHPEAGDRIAQLAIENAQERIRAAQKVARKRIAAGRRCPASWPTAPARSRGAPSCSWSRATRRAARPSRHATRISRRSCRCAARS